MSASATQPQAIEASPVPRDEPVRPAIAAECRGLPSRATAGRRLSSDRPSRPPVSWLGKLAAPLAALVLCPLAMAGQKIWGQYGDNYADVPSFVSPAVGQDLEAADDFDVQGPIDRVVVMGRLCFACSAPNISGLRLRFWSWENGEVGTLQAEYAFVNGAPNFLYDPLNPSSLDLRLPTPFVASGKHFFSVQLETSDYSSWYWMTSGNGSHENSTLRYRNGASGFLPYSQAFGVIDRDLSYELWGDGTAAPSTIPVQVWYQGPHFTGKGVPASAWPSPAFYAEPADDFQFKGQVTRVQLNSQVCFNCPYPTVTGAQIRFFEWTSNGPGALQFERNVPVGPGQTVFEGLITNVYLDPPFVASGKHFVSVVLQATNNNGFQWRTTGNSAAYGSALWYRDSTTGPNFGPWIQAGQPYQGDLAYQMYGLPDPLPPLIPTGDPCGPWNGLHVPVEPLTNFGVIRDLAVISSQEAWAVGDTTQQLLPLQATGGPQIWRWDGAAWTLEPTPNPELFPGAGGNGLLAVAAVSSADVWAAGTKRTTGPDGFVGQQLWVLHYDGSQWSEVPAPVLPGGVTGAVIRDIEALASDDIWFVGDWMSPVGCDPGLAMHWDGSGFTIYPTPCDGLFGAINGFGLEAISAVDSNDIWAVGGDRDGDYTYFPVYIIHWDGSQWSHFEHQVPGFGHRLWAVEALASDDVWASGDYFDAFGYHAYAVHWNGQSWSFMDIPGGGRHLWSSGNGSLYAAGSGVFRYDGTNWTWVDDLGMLSGATAGVSLSAIEGAGDCEMMAVGRHIDLGAIKPFAARVGSPGLWTAFPRQGCAQGNLADSLVLTSGAKLGANVSVQFDDPTGQLPLTPGSSQALWFCSLGPSLQMPCGPLVPGYGLAGSPAELLIDLSLLILTLPAAGPWVGPGLPVTATQALPNNPGLLGLTVFSQGLWLTPGPSPQVLMTNGIDLLLGN
jgi:hypothetical protein